MERKEPISFYLHETSKLFHNRVKEEMDKLGVNPSYRFVFMTINFHAGKAIQSDVCDLTHFKKSSVSLLLQEMEDEGYILREKDTVDSRKVYLIETEKGKKMDNKMKKIFAEKEKEMTSSLSEDEFNELYLLFGKMIHSLKGDEENV